MIRRVLVAVDFRQPSLAAARWVATHLNAVDEIELAHVVRRTELPPFLQGLSLPASAARRDPGLESVDRALQGLAGTLHWRRISVVTLEGHPVHALAGRAVATGADLLVLGRDVLDGSRGRTLERLVRRLPIPVLAVGSAMRERPTQVIAWVDAGPLRTGVVRCAGVLARFLGSELMLWNSASAHTGIVQGAAAPSLRAEAKSRVTLVVVGRNGADADGRSDLGSSTRRILAEARGPVLVVPIDGAWLPMPRLIDSLRDLEVVPQPATTA